MTLTAAKKFRIIIKLYPGVAQLVARMVRVHEAVGSTPATRTIGEFRRDSPIFYVNCWVLKIFDLASREDSYK